MKIKRKKIFANEKNRKIFKTKMPIDFVIPKTWNWFID